MGILGKVIGLTAVAVGGAAAATKAIVDNTKNGKSKRLIALEEEFAQTTRIHNEQIAKLRKKADKGSRGAQRQIDQLEQAYAIQKQTFEKKRLALLPKKSNAEIVAELKEKEHRMEMEKLETAHMLHMEEIENANIREIKLPLPETAICVECGSKNPSEAKFCNACGKELIRSRFCTGCGAKLNSDSKFCSMCGTAVKI